MLLWFEIPLLIVHSQTINFGFMISIDAKRETLVMRVIIVLSIAIPIVVALLLFLPRTGQLGDWDATFLPHLNAVLNTGTSLCLVGGYFAIKSGRKISHRNFMMSAFTLSAIFLISYVIYHAQVGHVKYQGEGLIRYVYFFVLITHIILSTVVVPLVLFAIYYAFSGQFVRHKRMVKWTYPVWLYVAISGVMAYAMLSPYLP